MEDRTAQPSVITRLERQKKNKNRVNVYIDEVYAFSLHEDVLVKYRLLKGRQIDPDEMEEILKMEERNRAEQYALRYIGHRPRTVEEVKQHLLQKGFPAEAITEVIHGCIEHNYLDDERFASQWVEERLRLKPRGRHMLRHELRSKGIDAAVIEHAISGVHADTEYGAALSAARKKYSRVSFSAYADLRNKIGPFLQRKGFSLDVINRVIEKLNDEPNHELNEEPDTHENPHS
ncbi:RecX family transcriptional regulator [Aneurinibacillus terranovensis]|uniref:RecX family transcriptional regulator n=1 Tax=Aneurinibacillus terranovensis TaxID=278991 RepID=UPI0003FB4195|nr:RecX family transcriptional regulator [Aneurinibacillus terranovensis]